MKYITVQYQYFDDSICGRCIDTEQELHAAIGAFTSRCRNVQIELLKQKLSRGSIEKSPTILVDGVDIETILTRSCVVKEEVSCRSYGKGDALPRSELLMGLSKYLCDGNKQYSYPCTC